MIDPKTVKKKVKKLLTIDANYIVYTPRRLLQRIKQHNQRLTA